MRREVKGHVPVRQGSSEVALDVGVHDGLEVLEFAVLQEVDDVDLQNCHTSAVFNGLNRHFYVFSLQYFSLQGALQQTSWCLCCCLLESEPTTIAHGHASV